MSVMALDIGTKRIGVAVSDPGEVIAFPRSTIERSTPDLDAEKIARIIAEHKVEVVVYGYPVTLRGKETETGTQIEDYIAGLKRVIKLPFEKIDERLTSVEAEKRLREAGKKPSRDKAGIDAAAAALILTTYLRKRKGYAST